MELVNAMKKTGKAVEKAFQLSPDTDDMDVLDKLKQEHEDVQDMLERLVDCTSAATRKSLLKQVKMALVPHSRAEEKVVYDAILAKRDREAKVDGEEGYYEHHLADKMLAELDAISNVLSPEFTAASKVLKELIEHHVKEEEHDVFGDVREHFDDDERIEMNRMFEAAKKKVRIPA